MKTTILYKIENAQMQDGTEYAGLRLWDVFPSKNKAKKFAKDMGYKVRKSYDPQELVTEDEEYYISEDIEY